MTCRRCDLSRDNDLGVFLLTEVPLWFGLFLFGVILGAYVV